MAKRLKGLTFPRPIRINNLIPMAILIVTAWGTFNWLNSFISTAQYFRVDKVEILLIGRVPLSNETVRRLLSIHKGRNIFDVDLKATRDYIVSNYPDVRTVVINRVFPNKLVLNIRPRKAVAQVSVGSGICLVDQEGVVLPGVRGLAVDGLVMISGIDTRSILASVGKRYDYIGLKKALQLLEVVNQLGFLEEHQLHTIDVADEKNISLYIEGGIEIKIGGGDFRNKLIMLNKAFEGGQLDRSHIKYIDLRFGNVIIGPR